MEQWSIIIKNSQHTWDNAMEIDEDLEQQKLSKY